MERPEGKEKLRWEKSINSLKVRLNVFIWVCVFYITLKGDRLAMLEDQIISFDWQNHIKVFGVVFLRLSIVIAFSYKL